MAICWASWVLRREAVEEVEGLGWGLEGVWEVVEEDLGVGGCWGVDCLFLGAISAFGGLEEESEEALRSD